MALHLQCEPKASPFDFMLIDRFSYFLISERFIIDGYKKIRPGKSAVSPEMELRLSKVLGVSRKAG